MPTKSVLAMLLAFALTGSALAQQKQYEWIRASDELVRLDPSFYRSGRVYHPGSGGGSMHVDIAAQQPITVAMATEADWMAASSNPEAIRSLRFWCVRQQVMSTTYTCELPSSTPMVLVIHDERDGIPHAVAGGVGAVLRGASAVRNFVSPNDVHITYYRWACVENCNQPEYQWIRQWKEKYEISAVPRIFSPLAPESDGERLSVKIKAPVPMVVAVVPSEMADKLASSPAALDSVVSNTACKQRGVQSLTFGCNFNVADAPLSLVVLPEPAVGTPRHKKAEIEVFAYRCVNNCDVK